MKKLILVLSIIFIGCETNQNRENANWDFDSSTGDYIQWQSDNDFANESVKSILVTGLGDVTLNRPSAFLLFIKKLKVNLVKIKL